MSTKLKHIADWLLALSMFCTGEASASAANTHTWAEHSVLSQGTWVKVALSQRTDGIYQISYAQLKSWGFSNPSQVAVYGYGGHVLPESLANGHLDDVPEVAVCHDKEGQRILFYGQGLVCWRYDDGEYFQSQHPYATYASYFLHQKEDEAPQAIALQQASDATPEVVLNDYDDYWLHETETKNIGQSGKQWFGESLLNTQSQVFSLPEDPSHQGHPLKAGTARLTVNFVTKASAATSYSVKLDNTTIGDRTIAATTGSHAFGTEGKMNKVLTDAADLSKAQIRITYAPGSNSPTLANLDYIRLQGKCELKAITQQPFFLFRNQEAQSKLVGYSIKDITPQMQVWDVTSPIEICSQQLRGDTLLVAQTKGIREYAVVDLSSKSFPGVSRIGTIRNQDLHGIEPVNLVILTPPAFMQQAEQLAQHRLDHDHLSSLVLTPDAIYNEYSSGVPDATAIRLFLKQLYDQGMESDGTHTLKYFLLLGDGTYDNHAATLSNNLLPTYQTDASMIETSSCVCDDYFGFLDDNEGGRTDSEGHVILQYDRLDIGIGRIPVRTIEQAQQVVDKIIGYDTDQYGNWKNRLCFLSDDDKIESSATDSPNAHMKHSDALIDLLQKAGHMEFMCQKIYLPAYQQTTSSSGTDYPDARKELNNALQQGVLILNYAGHGAPTSIAHEQIMTANLASQLRMKHLPVWFTASCDVTKYDAEDTSMGENLMLNPNGGAAALITTTRVVYSSQNLMINKAFYNNLFRRHSDGSRFRLGDVLKAAKQDLNSDSNKLNYCLIGDPSMTIAFPDQKIVVDTIVGDFKALSQVTIRGRVLKIDSQETDTLYNGLIYPTIFDAPDSITADKGLHQEPIFTFASRKRKIFTGRDIVKAGQFEFSFLVPEDISYNKGTGLVNLYACDVYGIEANGYYDGFTLRHGEEPEVRDSIGPTIVTCFMDAPGYGFGQGDKVSATPFLYVELWDESGINATGNSIGHDISLNLRCISNPLIANRQYVLNDYFTTFTGSPTHGNIKYSLTDLEEGSYEGTLRVWDVYNNVSTRTFTFTVSRQTRPEIALLQAYPSPVKQGDVVTFRALHNRPESEDQLRVQVYTQTGVKVLDQTISTNACEVVYLQPDAKAVTEISNALNADETSQLMGSTTLQWTANVAPGIYIYRAYLKAGGDEAASQSQKLIVF